MKKEEEMKKEKEKEALMFVPRRDRLAGRFRHDLVWRKLLEKLPRVKAVK